MSEVFSNVNGVEFMKSILSYFERERIFKYSGPRSNSRYVTSDGKRTCVTFKWEGDDLVMDNKDILLSRTDTPALRFNVDLALKMGWIQEKGNSYVLGPNLRIEFFDDVIPDIQGNGDLYDSDGNRVFFNVVKNPLKNADFLRLSIFCNWRFLNLNKAVIGSSSHSLLIYSNMGGGSVVGNQVTDLLREVNLIRRGAGVQYFEPLTFNIFPCTRCLT